AAGRTAPAGRATAVRPQLPAATATATTAATSATAGTGTTTAATATTVPTGTDQDVFFRLASDWGSAYPGQEVTYTFVVRNTGSTALTDLQLSSTLPNNLEPLGARADRGSDPQIDGQDVSYSLNSLAPGESIEIEIATRIKQSVAVGTLLVTQGQLQYDSLNRPNFSNIVTVQVVGQTAPAQTTSVPGGVLGGGAYPPPTGTAGTTIVPATVTASTVATTTMQPTTIASGGATPQPTATAPEASAPLPETSSGVPLAGVLLLGLTLLTRTVRLHRARERI
ncbi:MAG: DUF11 domain-containing protein, partial [Oscillochloris sp.]|nr:DUF11 domain-containing protein [Oscillochloris sp.]